jgi:phospholipase C
MVNADGSPGPNFTIAQRQQALDTEVYQLSPPQTGPYPTLPQPNTTIDGLPEPPGVSFPILIPDPGLDDADQILLSLGGTGQPMGQPDWRYPANLLNGPFPITASFQGTTCPPPPPQLTPVPYTSNTGDPIHRFYQMWQQLECSVAHITADNPSGCESDLYTWVALSVGWGGQGNPLPPWINEQTTLQGGVAMGFYNMTQGDFPYFQSLARSYASSDNYHQPFLGGTGINSIAIGTGDVLFYADSDGNPALPPADQIEDPDPFPSSNNWYKSVTQKLIQAFCPSSPDVRPIRGGPVEAGTPAPDDPARYGAGRTDGRNALVTAHPLRLPCPLPSGRRRASIHRRAARPQNAQRPTAAELSEGGRSCNPTFRGTCGSGCALALPR